MPPMQVEVLRRAVVDALYPRRCLGCGRFGVLLCRACLEAARRPNPRDCCSNCSAWWAPDDLCPRCRFWETTLDGCRAAFAFEGIARRAVHALKYLYVRDIAPAMAAEIAPLADRFDVVAPIPLHASRRRERGYNQAELLAEACSLPLLPGRLQRVRRTKQQVGRGLNERRANVRGAFAYVGKPLAGMRIALVDDVVTSGATALACAAVLKDHGARTVHVLAFARASYDPDAEAEITDDVTA